MIILETLLEILKYTIPAIIVYLLIRQFMKQQMQLSAMNKRSETKRDTLALRFQAYERLVLLCERIKLSDLVIRLSNEDMTPMALKNALMVSVQREYEHNITQQLYVSGQLWNMIELLKDNVMSVITSSYVQHEKSTIKEYTNDLLLKDQELESKIGSKVKMAIRKEVELYFQ